MKNVKFLYFECESLEVLSNDFANKILKNEIRTYAEKLKCMFLDKQFFSISNFLSTGFPFKNKEVGKVAFILFEYWNYKNTSKKIIFIDLNVRCRKIYQIIKYLKGRAIFFQYQLR